MMEDPAAAAVPKLDSRFSCNICLDPVTEPVVTHCGHLFCWPCLYRWLEPGIRPDEALPSWPSVVPRPVDESRRCCPVCKAECSVPTVIPIYVRNEPTTPQAQSNTPAQDDERDEAQQEASSHSSHEPEEEPTGLRQRLRFRSRDSDIPNDDVPSRPAAISPTRNSHSSMVETSAEISLQQQPYHRPAPLSPHRASLSHGMLLLFQQALTSDSQQPDAGVPPLHRQPGLNNRGAVESPRDDATEFLSRLLLILASFVILCLLLF